MLVADNSLLVPFKGKHEGQSAIVFGTGSSLEQFSWSLLPETPDISAGVNFIIFRDDIKLDYYFAAHYIHDSDAPPVHYADKIVERSRPKMHPDGFLIPRKGMQVFIGAAPYARHVEFPLADVARMHNAIVFELTDKFGSIHFAHDLVSMPFYNHSMIFSPMQLLLYAGVKRIYLVGCDCGGKYSCIDVKDGTQKIHSEREFDYHVGFVDYWKEFLPFKLKHYPDVEIISVNPRGLAGMFTDLYL